MHNDKAQKTRTIIFGISLLLLIVGSMFLEKIPPPIVVLIIIASIGFIHSYKSG